MKHPILILLIALMWAWAPLCALDVRPFLRGSAAGSAPPATYLINQNFEGTGYDNTANETWNTSVGSPNADYAPALLGSESLLANTHNTAARVRTDFTGADTLYGYFLFRRVDTGTGNPAGDRLLFELTINGGTTRALALSVTSTGALKVQDLSGTRTGTTPSATSVDVTYHVWWSYTKGDGDDATGTVAWSTDGTKPTSGNQWEDFDAGTSTVQGGRIFLGYTGTNAETSFVYDKVLVDDVDIGSNP